MTETTRHGHAQQRRDVPFRPFKCRMLIIDIDSFIRRYKRCPREGKETRIRWIEASLRPVEHAWSRIYFLQAYQALDLNVSVLLLLFWTSALWCARFPFVGVAVNVLVTRMSGHLCWFRWGGWCSVFGGLKEKHICFVLPFCCFRPYASSGYSGLCQVQGWCAQMWERRVSSNASVFSLEVRLPIWEWTSCMSCVASASMPSVNVIVDCVTTKRQNRDDKNNKGDTLSRLNSYMNQDRNTTGDTTLKLNWVKVTNK